MLSSSCVILVAPMMTEETTDFCTSHRSDTCAIVFPANRCRCCTCRQHYHCIEKTTVKPSPTVLRLRCLLNVCMHNAACVSVRACEHTDPRISYRTHPWSARSFLQFPVCASAALCSVFPRMDVTVKTYFQCHQPSTASDLPWAYPPS